MPSDPSRRGSGRAGDAPPKGPPDNADGLFAPMTRIPYLTGVYLAVNAIRDVYLVVDGPNCAFFRIPQVQPNHDWQADLARASGLHRIVDTDSTPNRIAQADNRVLLQRLVRADRQPDCAAILLTPMAIVALAGRQYEPLLESIKPPLDHPVLFVEQGSLTGDWLDGYAAVLHALADQMDLVPSEDGAALEDSVAIVGHLHHRNEADVEADAGVIRALVEGLGLPVSSVWPEGGPLERLALAGRSRWIVSLPYGRAAARRLSERTGAELLELDLPLGLEATARWVRGLGEATGRVAQAERLVDAALSRVVPRLARVLPNLIAGRRVAVSGDPALVTALCPALEELGCAVTGAAVLGTGEHVAVAARALGPSVPVRAQTEPGLQRLVEGEWGDEPADLVIASSPGIQMVRNFGEPTPTVELGFPSYTTHAFYPLPLLGFDGVLALVTRLVNALLAAEGRPRSPRRPAPELT